MNVRYLSGPAVALVLWATPFVSGANALVLKGKSADSFIARHFPNAYIPGPVKGRFSYINSRGLKRMGRADCNVPAMGAHSMGAVSMCRVTY